MIPEDSSSVPSLSANERFPIHHEQTVRLAKQVSEMQDRVEEMESALISYAERLHDTLSGKLDHLFSDEDKIVEFSLPEGEGVLRVAGEAPAQGVNPEVMDSLEVTRQEISRLNQTIERLQLAR